MSVGTVTNLATASTSKGGAELSLPPNSALSDNANGVNSPMGFKSLKSFKKTKKKRNNATFQ
jgi:hypothetical protein